MKLFIDTANIQEIRTANEMGIISGVTTNPTIISREGREFTAVIKEIASMVDGPIFAEVMSANAEGMVAEALELAKIAPNIAIKIPMCTEGLKAVSALSKKGIKTNVTLVFSAVQALLAARAGANYCSPFVGRIDDTGWDGMRLIGDISNIFRAHGIETKIISASVRHPVHIIEAAKAGCDIATVPYKVLMQCIEHPLTKAGIDKFNEDWQKVPKK